MCTAVHCSWSEQNCRYNQGCVDNTCSHSNGGLINSKKHERRSLCVCECVFRGRGLKGGDYK